MKPNKAAAWIKEKLQIELGGGTTVRCLHEQDYKLMVPRRSSFCVCPLSWFCRTWRRCIATSRAFASIQQANE
jgi:hypothetical protein